MPSIRDVTNVGVGAVIANILAGSEFEFIPVPAQITVAMATDGDDMTCDITFGNTIQLQAGSIPRAPVANTGPRLPDDVIISDVADAGDRLVVRLRGGAAALDVRTLVRIVPLM